MNLSNYVWTELSKHRWCDVSATVTVNMREVTPRVRTKLLYALKTGVARSSNGQSAVLYELIRRHYGWAVPHLWVKGTYAPIHLHITHKEFKAMEAILLLTFGGDYDLEYDVARALLFITRSLRTMGNNTRKPPGALTVNKPVLEKLIEYDKRPHLDVREAKGIIESNGVFVLHGNI